MNTIVRLAGSTALLLAVFFAALSGCSSEPEKYKYSISYVDSAQTRTVQVGYQPRSKSIDGMIQEFLEQLAKDTDSVDYVRTIPQEVGILAWEVEQDCLNLDFNNAYDKLEPVAEILCRLAIVQTMTQIDGITSVRFSVRGEPLRDSKGDVVGNMTIDSFVENPGEQINSYQHAAIDLYFSNKEGDRLLKETQEVYFNSNIAMEKLVIEHLISGPKNKEAKKTIPEETKLINIAVVDGSCYVNLNESFLNQNYEVQEPVVIYSIVNSLGALSNIEKVQISVNGDTSGTYRDTMELSQMYQPDYSYVNLRESYKDVIKDE